MRGSGNGPISLVSEFIVSRIATQLGWPVPDAQWIQIPDNLPWTFGSDEFDDIVQKSYGWNLGINYIQNSEPMHWDPRFLTDPVLVSALYTIDVFFMNIDRTKNACNLLRDANSNIWIIDHGALGLFQQGVKQSNGIPPNHIFYDQAEELKYRYHKIIHNPEIFQETISRIPVAIMQSTYFTKDSIQTRIRERIEFLEKTIFIR